jgi:branched-chain amino acid aminotransferase
MIHRYVYHNDLVLPVEQVRLSPGQAGLLNGWGLFTTLRIVEGEAFAYERHWRRLVRDAARARLPFPFDAEDVRRKLAEVVRANQVRQGSARIYLIYNRTGFWQSEESLPEVDLILYTAGLPPHREPARLDLRPHGRHAASPLSSVKTTAWLNNVWHLHQAQQAGFDEVLLLNERGEIAECTAANIFLYRGGRILTPPLTSGCLEGVTRAVLLEIAPGAGVPVEERALLPGDLANVEEVFISSTNRNLLGVSEVGPYRFPNAPGPVTAKLNKLFDEYVAAYIAQRAAAAAPRR